MPPALLISSAAILAPLGMPTPLIAEVSAMTPILIGSAAWAGAPASAIPTAAAPTTPILCDKRMNQFPFLPNTNDRRHASLGRTAECSVLLGNASWQMPGNGYSLE